MTPTRYWRGVLLAHTGLGLVCLGHAVGRVPTWGLNVGILAWASTVWYLTTE